MRAKMFEIKGKFTTALVTTNDIEDEAIAQITELVNSPASYQSKIVIMPDAHAGKGCVIGTTMTIHDRVVPNLVGVDIGCGVLVVPLDVEEIDFEKLQSVIDEKVPSGFNVHDTENMGWGALYENLRCPVPREALTRIKRSVGTLGGGNHFISIEVDSITSQPYLIIHTGSRSLGTLVARHYQDLAEKTVRSNVAKDLVETLKALGREKDIERELKKLKDSGELVNNKALSYLTDKNMEDYLNDMNIAQKFAAVNRAEIARTIISGMGWHAGSPIESVHNYIDFDGKEIILRKGAVNTYKGIFVVPLNMRDGSLLCARGDVPEWNYSGPHGAGRRMSRSVAKRELSLEDFKATMAGVWSKSVGQSTLDEAPEAYKPAEEIKELVSGTYDVIAHLIPVFNFKASDEVD